MRFTSVFLALFSFTTLVWASPIAKRVVYPESDSFWTPPSGWESKANGAILATRKVTAAALTLIPTLSVTTYQILYKTTDQEDRAIATVTTIFVPLNADKSKLLAFGVAEDSNAAHCAPSYQYQLGSDSSNLIAQAELILIQIALSQGWVVTTADYEGPQSAWIAGRLAGRSVLDSIRATTAFSDLGITSGAKVAMWGYSGGANAVGWAAALHPTYAPDINLVGVAQGGTPANLSATVLSLDGGIFAGFAAEGLAGLYQVYSAVKAKLDAAATDKWAAVYNLVRSRCALDGLILNIGGSFFSGDYYFKNSSTILLDPSIKDVMDSLTLGSTAANEVPSVPIFVYHSGSDQIVPYAQASTMVDNYCSKGVNLKFITNTDHAVGHASMEVFTIPRTIAFLRDRFAGKTYSGNCERTNVGVSSLAGAIKEAVQFGLPGLVPLITLAVAAFQALPAI